MTLEEVDPSLLAKLAWNLESRIVKISAGLAGSGT